MSHKASESIKQNNVPSREEVAQKILAEIVENKIDDESRLVKWLKIVAGQLSFICPPSEFQYPGMYFPELVNTPWYDPTRWEWTLKFEEQFEKLREELYYILEKRKGFQPYEDSDELSCWTGIWNTFYLCYNRQLLPDSVELAPTTSRLIQEIPRLGELAMYSALNPGSHIKPHCGPWNARITFHLGIIVPSNCMIRVGNEIRRWQEGKFLAFDDSYEHEVLNNGNNTRIVLLVDIWHPELTDYEIYYLERFSKALQLVDDDLLNRGKKVLEGKKWWI